MMVTISNYQGRRTIQFLGQDGKRHSIRLGKISAGDTNTIKLHVVRILQSKTMNLPLHLGTAEWLTKIDDELYDRFARFDLCPPRDSSSSSGMPLAKMLDDYIARRTDMKPWSIKMLKQARNKLVEFFGENKPIGKINAADAEDFRRHVSDKVSGAYVAKLVRLSRQFFRDAVKRKLLEDSPFADVKAGSQKNKARQRFIAREIIDKAIEHAPDIEWKLIIAFARYGGLRIPSEILELRWEDIWWDKNRILVHSPKTEHHEGHATREIPLFPELRSLLVEAKARAKPDDVYLITRYRCSNQNLRTEFLRILKKSEIEPWPKLFQNLRSTRQTELTLEYPEYVVCAWIGNSEKVAQDHYLQVLNEQFSTAALGKKQPVAPSAEAKPASENKSVASTDDNAIRYLQGKRLTVPISLAMRKGNKNDIPGAESDAAPLRFNSHDEAPQFSADSITPDPAATNENVPGNAGTCETSKMGAEGFEPSKA